MNRNQLLATAVVAALSTGLATSGMMPAFGADDTMTSAEAPAPAEKHLIEVSDDALMTMRDVRSARLAIFNGLPLEAQTYADAATVRIAATIKDAEKYAVDTKNPPADDTDTYVPFDASLTIADTFVPTEETMKQIEKANEHLHKGEKNEAIEALKLGEVDVAVSAGLVPVKLAKKEIDTAAKLIGERKYYEANLALKKVEDAVVIETFVTDAVAKKESKS